MECCVLGCERLLAESDEEVRYGVGKVELGAECGGISQIAFMISPFTYEDYDKNILKEMSILDQLVHLITMVGETLSGFS